MVEAAAAPETSNEWILPKKVASYPAVSATYNTASYYYEATKGYNSWTEWSANYAERAAGAVAQPLYNASLPVLNRFEPKLHEADKYAAGKLDQLEEKAPLINEEPAAIYRAAKDKTVSTINQSYVGQAVNYAIKPVLTVAERWTPASPTKEKQEAETETPPENSNQSTPEEHVTLQQTVKRAYQVGTKLQQRALEKAMENVTSLRKRSQESLDSLRHAVDLIQYMKTLESATGADKVRAFVNDILEEDEQEVEKESTTDSSNDMNRKTLVVSRKLTRKLKTGYELTMTHAKPYLNEALFARLQHGQTLLEGIHKSFSDAKNLKDVSDAWIETTKSHLDYLSQSLKDISQETISWLSWGKSQDSGAQEGDSREASGSVSSYAPSESLDEDVEPRREESSREESSREELNREEEEETKKLTDDEEYEEDD